MDEIIEVECTDVTDRSGCDHHISITPEGAVIQEVASLIKTFSNDIKEYQIAKEHELTRRAEIKANMKITMAEIEARKEIFMKALDNEHEKKMEHIDSYNKIMLESLNAYIDTIKVARELAQKENDFTNVISLLDKMNDMVELRSRFLLELVDETSASNLPFIKEEKYLSKREIN